jgi:DNA-binding NarL/FixJ family response regulator
MSSDPTAHARTFDRVRAVRAEALEHTRIAQRLFLERRELLRELVDAGFSHADIGRELGVTRQAIQKMLA